MNLALNISKIQFYVSDTSQMFLNKPCNNKCLINFYICQEKSKNTAIKMTCHLAQEVTKLATCSKSCSTVLNCKSENRTVLLKPIDEFCCYTNEVLFFPSVEFWPLKLLLGVRLIFHIDFQVIKGWCLYQESRKWN